MEERALVDVRAQRETLLADFAAWNERVALTGDLKQHHTQVHRVTGQLSEALSAALVGTVLEKDGVKPKLADIDAPREAVEVVHLIWDFFRDRLCQRDTARYRNHLGAADDLAWDCYLPFVEAKVAAVSAADVVAGAALRARLKEPPLVSYAPERGLYAQSRQSAYVPQGLTAVDVDRFGKALQHLPVPIITIPWSHASRASCLVYVAHEAGHVVADDLELKDEMERMIRRLKLGGDVERWVKWLPEVFADVFGTAALGTAYVDGLAALLALPLNKIRGEEMTANGEYPTRALRLALCSSALEVMKIASYADWEDTYGSASPEAYVKDTKCVAAALLKKSFPGLGDKNVGGLLGWSAVEEKLAATVANALVTPNAPAAPPVAFGVRRWIAGAAQAERRDPTRFRENNVDSLVVDQIAGKRPAGVRAQRTAALRGALTRGAQPVRAEDQAREDQARDRAAGRELADVLGLIRKQDG